MENEKVYKMKFAKVYSLLIAKAERKGRTKSEVDAVICWLTGYSEDKLLEIVDSDEEYDSFFKNAPKLNPNRKLITGSVCGVKLAEIQDELMLEIRYLDKLIDELAKGKSMEKILREEK